MQKSWWMRKGLKNHLSTIQKISQVLRSWRILPTVRSVAVPVPKLVQSQQRLNGCNFKPFGPCLFVLLIADLYFEITWNHLKLASFKVIVLSKIERQVHSVASTNTRWRNDIGGSWPYFTLLHRLLTLFELIWPNFPLNWSVTQRRWHICRAR